ncbi:MAG: glycosyltransferase family 9 protein [bacterium]
MNFLVIRFSSLGDVILTGPVFENLKLNYPGSFIYFLTKKNYAAVFRGSPFIDRVVVLEDFSFFGLIKFLKKIKPVRVFDLHASLRSRLVDLFFPGKVFRVNTYRAQRKRMLGGKTAMIPNAVERYLETLKKAGIKIHTARPKLSPEASEKNKARGILSELGIPVSSQIICIAPQSKWKNKEWPHFEKFFEIAVKPGRFFLLAGDDFQKAEQIMPANRYIRNFVKNTCGSIGMGTLFAVLALSRCVISMDSGVAHAASALGRPLIDFFGPTVPAFGFAPPEAKIMEVDVPCRPCHLHGGNVCKRGDRVCLGSISERELLEEVEKILR